MNVIESARRNDIELFHLRGEPGYDDEEIIISNSVGNGLRIEITNEDMDWAVFQINSAAEAIEIASRLIEWSTRICDPVAAPVTKEQ